MCDFDAPSFMCLHYKVLLKVNVYIVSVVCNIVKKLDDLIARAILVL